MAYTDWIGINGLPGLFTALNTNTDGLFGIVAWVIAYFVIFTVFTASSAAGRSNAPAKDGFMGSGIVMAIVAIVMSALEWVPPYLSAVPIVLSLIGIIVITRKND